VPLYEYKCLKCGRRTEKIETVSGPHLKKCPHCGGKVEQMISAPAIQFKGSGWYVTDYAGKSKVGSASSDDRSSDEKSSADEKKSSDKKHGDSADSKDSSKNSAKGSASESKDSKPSSSTDSSKEKKSEKSKKN
jgi:putative FmdB family regulatory protein